MDYRVHSFGTRADSRQLARMNKATLSVAIFTKTLANDLG
jgi:hypothetical protein